jgi:serine/threonine protein kinase
MQATPSCNDAFELQRAVMLESDTLRRFWEFATTIRRTRSTAARESSKIRGVWLTSDLVVQRVHGWSLQAVRLICIRATDEEHAKRLEVFFTKDRRNVEGRLATAKDPLDKESRVLVKIPYEASLDGWVDHEWQVLRDLEGIPGVPSLAGPPILFEDIGVRALVLTFSPLLSLQERLEEGRELPVEDFHSVASFLLTTLDAAHQHGWIHGDIQPKDLLLNLSGSQSKESVRILRQETMKNPAMPLICGWSNAIRVSKATSVGQSAPTMPLLVQLASNRLEAEDRLPQQMTSQGLDKAAAARENFMALKARLASLAPEEYVTLFTGSLSESEVTDVYRAATAILMAFRPMASSGLSPTVDSKVATCVDMLRKLSHHALSKRLQVQVSKPTDEEYTLFEAGLTTLLRGKIRVDDVGFSETQSWLQRCLARDPCERWSSCAEALEELNVAWSQVEARLLHEHKQQEMEQSEEAIRNFETGRRNDEDSPNNEGHLPKPGEKGFRLAIAPPPELRHMQIV